MRSFPPTPKFPERKSFTAVVASGMLHMVSETATNRSRCGVVTTFASSQRITTDFRYSSDKRFKLPPGQYESGTVSTAHPERAAAIISSRLRFSNGCRCLQRSHRRTAVAPPAARNAIRKWPRTGMKFCGESSMMKVKATSEKKAALPPESSSGSPGLTAFNVALCLAAGDHHATAELAPEPRFGAGPSNGVGIDRWRELMAGKSPRV